MTGDTNTDISQESHAESGPASSGSQVVGVPSGSSSGSGGGATSGSTAGGGSTEDSKTITGDDSFDSGQTSGATVSSGNVSTSTTGADPAPETLHAETAAASGPQPDSGTWIVLALMVLGFAVVYRKLPAPKS